MSEERETSESGCEAEGGHNPAAVALALGGASREKADAFLDKQSRFADIQTHHLNEQFEHLSEQFKQLRLAGSDSVTGTDADLDTLIPKAAEQVYKLTQPYRYGVYLNSNGRAPESIAVFKQIATAGPLPERGWGSEWPILAKSTLSSLGSTRMMAPQRLVSTADKKPIFEYQLVPKEKVEKSIEQTIVPTKTISLCRRQPDSVKEYLKGLT